MKRVSILNKEAEEELELLLEKGGWSATEERTLLLEGREVAANENPRALN